MNIEIPSATRTVMNIDIPSAVRTVMENAPGLKILDSSKLVAVAESAPGIGDALRRILLNIITCVVVMFGVMAFFKSDTYLELIDTSGQMKLIKSYGKILTYVLAASNAIAQQFPTAFNTINAVIPAYTSTLLHRLLFEPTKTLSRYKTLGLRLGNAPKIGAAAVGGMMLNALPMGGGMIIGPQLTHVMIESIKRLQNMNNKTAKRAYLTASVVVGGQARFVRNYVEDVTRTAIRQGLVAVVSVLAHHTFETAKGVRNLAHATMPSSRRLTAPVKVAPQDHTSMIANT